MSATLTAELSGAYMLRMLSGESVPQVPEQLMARAEALRRGLEELVERYPWDHQVIGDEVEAAHGWCYAPDCGEELGALMERLGIEMGTPDGAALLMLLLAPEWVETVRQRVGKGVPDRFELGHAHLTKRLLGRVFVTVHGSVWLDLLVSFDGGHASAELGWVSDDESEGERAFVAALDRLLEVQA